MKLKPVHYLLKHETVHLSLKDDCYPGLAHFGNDQFPFSNENEGEKNVIKTLDSFSFDGVHPIEVPFKKPITKNAKTLFQHFFSDSYIEDPVGSRKPGDIIPFRTDLVSVLEVNEEEKTTTSPKINPCTPEKSSDSEDANLQLKTVHQTNPYVLQQSMNNSSYDPSLFQHKSQLN